MALGGGWLAWARRESRSVPARPGAKEGCGVRTLSEVPVRVLQVVAGLKPSEGGPPESALATALALRKRGFENSLAYADVPGNEAAANAELLLTSGVKVHRFSINQATRSPGVRWGISLRLAIWLLRNAHKFDVLHMHAAWTFTAAVGLLAARIRGRVAVLSTHESLTDFDRSKSSPLKRLVKRLLRGVYLRLFDLVVVSTPLEQRDSGDPSGRYSAVVPHGVRGVGRISPPKIGDSPLRVGFLGRLHPKKNLALLFEALAAADERIALLVAGDGPAPYVEELRRHARDAGVARRVTWLGFVGAVEKARFLSSIDVLAMPSQYESFGVAAVEAMSAGVPVIVTPTVGVADYVARYGAGSVVSADAAALAAALSRLAANPALVERAGEAALSAACEFSLERHGAMVEREYLRVLSRSRDFELSRVTGELG